jgi:spectinomycin phosphotransferase
MRVQPADLDDEAILAALREHWDWGGSTIEYVALGMGTHHWVVTDDTGQRRFVDVDVLENAAERADRALARRCQAFESTRALRDDAGLHFVVAPIPATNGDVMASLTSNYAMTVFPWIEAQPETGDRTRELGSMLVRLHAATSAVAATAARETFAIPRRECLDRALHELDVQWDGGPFSEPAREALTQVATEVGALVARYDAQVADAGSPSDRWVVTHGEPHDANLVESADGLVLVDWDTLLIAPPERDLWWVDDAVATEYTAATGVVLDADLVALYRLWFDLDKIAQYTAQFRGPHRLGLETSETWDIFTIFLDQARRGAHG